MLRTPNLRSWIAADATHLHHTIFINTANSVCRGAGDSHLPRSMRARSPHVLFPRQQFQRGTKFREPTGQRITTGDYAGALELDTSSSRHGADWTAPAGDFVLCTTSLRGWTAADAMHLHHDIRKNTANLFARVQVILSCRGV